MMMMMMVVVGIYNFFQKTVFKLSFNSPRTFLCRERDNCPQNQSLPQDSKTKKTQQIKIPRGRLYAYTSFFRWRIRVYCQVNHVISHFVDLQIQENPRWRRGYHLGCGPTRCSTIRSADSENGKPYPGTKNEVNRMTHCGDGDLSAAILNFLGFEGQRSVFVTFYDLSHLCCVLHIITSWKKFKNQQI